MSTHLVSSGDIRVESLLDVVLLCSFVIGGVGDSLIWVWQLVRYRLFLFVFLSCIE